MGSSNINVVNIRATLEEDGGLPGVPQPKASTSDKCYHPDCGGKPKIFCPHKGSHPQPKKAAER